MATDLSFTLADVSASQASGSIINTYVAATGQTINVGDAVASNGLVDGSTGLPQVLQADGNDANFETAQAIGVVCQIAVDWYGGTAATAGQDVSVVNFGPIFLPDANMITGAIYYVSDTAGKISDTASSTHAWIIGQAIAPDTLFVSPRGTGSGNY